jgi:Tfp pilus assembly PilM family ATPase
MNSLNIDFRDKCLRVLIVKDDKAVSARLIKNFSLADKAQAKDKLSVEIRESGGKHDRVNIILPQDMVLHAIRQVPRAEADDISIILRRMITRELADDKFTFGFKEITENKKSSPGTKNILLEYVRNKDMSDHMTLLKECGIKPDVITSGFEGNMQLFNRLRPRTEGNETIIDIGAGYVEILIINNGNLMNYDKLQLLTGFSELSEGDEKTGASASKIKIYNIIDVLFKTITPYIKASGSEGLSKIWISGIGSTLEGITDSISSGFGISASLLSGLEIPNINGSAFSALSGVSTLNSAKEITSFIPVKIIERKHNIVKQAVIGASLTVYIALMLFTYLTAEKTEKELKAFLESKKAGIAAVHSMTEAEGDIYSEGRNTFFRIISASPSLYPVFRDIANLTPPGVQLQQIVVERKKGATILNIEATIKKSDEVYRKALLTKHLTGLEGSKVLRGISAPIISTSNPSKEESFLSVRSSYEVMK